MKNQVQSTSIAVMLIIALCFQSCTSDSPVQPQKISDFVSIDGQKFIDPYGRDLTLHGVNVVNKNPGTKYLGHASPEITARVYRVKPKRVKPLR